MEFNPGQPVLLKSDPSNTGAVLEVIPGEPENRVRVLLNGNSQTFYASQLETRDQKESTPRQITVDQFHAYLTALQIRNPELSKLYSLNAARVDFIPYQFRPVLKFIRSDRPRMLIADSVGVGKTIEAGLILRELQARRNVDSVLIICPRALVTERKWEQEMKRFDERFLHLDSKSFKHCLRETDLEGAWPDQYRRAILPYSLFNDATIHGLRGKGGRRNEWGLFDLDPPPRFDLVIVDEAHHIRNTDTYAHQAVRFFCENAEAALFLTATPIQLGDNDLFVLLNVLRPDLVLDRVSFDHMAEPNQYINRAIDIARAQVPDWLASANRALDNVGQTPWGQSIIINNPEFQRMRSTLSKERLGDDERVKLVTDLEGLHTFHGLISRTRRRDIGDFTIRKTQTVPVEFTEGQKRLHDDLLRAQAVIYSRLHGDVNVQFMLTTVKRQAASCLYGLVPLLEGILNRHSGELGLEDVDERFGLEPVLRDDVLNDIRSLVHSILEHARSLDSYDPKIEALRRVIRDRQKEPNNKIIVFSSFRHTLAYYSDGLERTTFGSA